MYFFLNSKLIAFISYHSVTLVPEPISDSIIALQPNLAQDCAHFCLLFLVIFVIVQYGPRALVPTWHSSLDAVRREDMGSYAIGTAHHIYLLSLSFARVYTDFCRTDEEALHNNYLRENSDMVAFCVAYFVVDTAVYALPQAFRGKKGLLCKHN